MDSENKYLFDPAMRKPTQLERSFEKNFDRPLSHRNDPLTSFSSGDEVLKSGRIKGQTRAVLTALISHPNRTSAELARLADLDRYSVARRLPNLAHRGLAERGPERMCQVCKSKCVTWRAV